MSKFKVGDKVKRISHHHNCPIFRDTNTIFTIKNVGGSRHAEIELEENPGHSYSESYFKLATVNESELERLVRVANEGLKALHTIRAEHRDAVESSTVSNEKEPDILRTLDFLYNKTCYSFAIGEDLKVKQKPKFEPFTVGSGWQVKLEGETLHIGCKRFKAATLKHDLKQLTCCQVYESGEIKASRKGVFSMYDYDHVVDWADADKILAALEKAGIK